MIKITFPDQSVREYESGVTGLQIAESISQRLAQECVACGVSHLRSNLHTDQFRKRQPAAGESSPVWLL